MNNFGHVGVAFGIQGYEKCCDNQKIYHLYKKTDKEGLTPFKTKCRSCGKSVNLEIIVKETNNRKHGKK